MDEFSTRFDYFKIKKASSTTSFRAEAWWDSEWVYWKLFFSRTRREPMLSATQVAIRGRVFSMSRNLVRA